MGALQGYYGIVCAANYTQAVTITIQRFLDPQCSLPVGASATATTTAGVPGNAEITVVLPAMYYNVKIQNAGTSTANLILAGIILMPNA